MTVVSKLLLTVSFLSFTLSSPLLATQGTEDLPKSKKRKREDDLSTPFTEPQNKKLTLEQKPTLATLRETIKTAKGKALEEAQEQLIDLLFDSGNPSIKPKDYATLFLHMEKRNPKALYLGILSYLNIPQLTPEEINDLKGYLEKERENKSKEALRNFYLGRLYHKGIRPDQLEPNAELAITLNTKAWDKGHVHAAVELGDLYRYGILGQLKPNAELAIAWYTKAWDNGVVRAADVFGALYQKGIPGQLEPNAELAITWLTKGWDKGDARAAIRLGDLYQDGIPGQLAPNHELSLKYFLLSRRLSILGGFLSWRFSHYLDIPTSISEITKDDSLEIEQDINTLKDHLQQARRIIDPEIMMNDPHSTASYFKDSLPIPELLAHYRAIGAYQTKVLTLLPALENPGFLVTWPKIRIVDDQEAIPNTDTEGTFLRRFTVNGQKYLTFGEENVPLSLELVALLKGEDESLVQAQKAIGLLRPMIQTLRDQSLTALIKEQQMKRFFAKEEDKNERAIHTKLIEHNSNLLTALESVEELQENLKIVFEQTTPLRNKRFIHYYKFPVVEENEKLKS
ncbi:tetratricopeptide repeat protein [Candidatus Nucleicultrix amoebiphila]|uniref:Sel1 repeat family protein n=1 Tax=Candidatus Nucleicultrix amoebiphila FS5 TaxID=1414854 RepID=A0A1W6N2N0_9PROT|nr:tetratricopeptide repeat protein [Candidatus Nucleicultrix amoebiphila]ARN84036.1 hypothetical protein GQ61_00220 [Candidatus Nucleicultrix amoebiphila FS5]